MRLFRIWWLSREMSKMSARELYQETTRLENLVNHIDLLSKKEKRDFLLRACALREVVNRRLRKQKRKKR